MNRRILSIAIFLAASVFTASCAGGHFFIVATSGTAQSTPINTAFGMPLVVTVTNGAGKGVKGVKVTFTAPSQSGPSATFAGGSGTATATTDSNGVATSQVVSANGNAGGPYTVVATVRLTKEPALFVLTNTGGTAAGISCVSGSSQSAQVDTAFANPLEVQVVDSGGHPTNDPGVVVTFTPPAQTGPSLTFAGGVNTATTNASGLATSVTITANGNAGGPYQVSASATIGETVKACNFTSLTNTAIPVTTENFVYYASGMETGPRFYSVAGVVTIETSGPNPGQVMGGEQDYNDGDGITSPQPSGDTITGGQLTVSSTTGQGTLTLVTNNQQVGGGLPGGVTAAGTEEFAVQFVNANHALVTQFDGSATSSGSLDLQSSTSAPSGSFAFTLSGVDTGYCPLVVGGVFTISGGSFSGGTFDYNDCGDLVTGTAFPTGAAGGTVGAPDASGRGSITDFAVGITLRYYVVGAEAIRIIDVDSTAPKIPYDSAVGSAFGQGSGGAFSNSSLGTFVFADSTNPWNAFYDAAGMLTTNPDAGTFQGVADNDEAGVVYSRVTIPSEGSSYSICGSAACGGNGYGSLTIPAEVLGDIGLFGVYMTDPNLNLNDPNNTASGTGGALITDLELIGTGVIVPQTSTSKASAGDYAFGAQGFNPSNNDEYDFVGQGSVAAEVLTGSGDIADPFLFFDTKNAMFTGATFTGTATPDGANPGRYTVSPLAVTPPVEGDSPKDFTVVLYQANGTQLFWMDEDTFSYFLGPVERQAAVVTPLPSAKVKAQAQPIQKK